MKKLTADELLEKYQAGEATEQERALVAEWYWQQDKYALPDAAEFLEDHFIIKDAILKHVNPARKVRLWPRIAGVAAAVALIVFGIWFYDVSRQLEGSAVPSELSAYDNDIAPGKNTATLTLPNGKTISLSDAKSGVVVEEGLVRYSSGAQSTGSLKGGQRTTDPIVVHSLASVEQLVVQTPRGGTYQVVLPDGTRVWLNADSKISFPSQFDGKVRKILLEGEAYFEVAKVMTGGKRMPFVVESAGQKVEVLGTHFNINSYADEGITKTTLLEGSVQVSKLGGQASGVERGVVLKPNEQSQLSSSNQISVKAINPNDVIDWKNGEFVFKSESLQSVMRKVARWYDIEVVYAADVPKDIELSGFVSRTLNISGVLDLIARTEKVKIGVTGRKVTITKIR